MRSASTESLPPTWTTILSLPTATASPGAGNGGGGGGSGGGDDDEDTLQRWSSLIGIITAIVGNMLIALALNVQRYAHTRIHKEKIRVRSRARAALKRAQGNNQAGTYGTILGSDDSDFQNGVGNGSASITSPSSDGSGMDREEQESEPLMASFQSSTTTTDPDDAGDKDTAKLASSYLKSPYWWLGQILITLGEMGNFLAYGFAPASIVSPLGVVALISNCIIAPAMFHEKFRPRDFWGVVIAVSGVVTVVLSANQEETKLNPHDVWGAITTMEFEIYLGVTMFLILVLMWASRIYGKRTILIDLGLVGLFGGYTALSTKGVSSMLSSTLWGAFTTPVTYVLMLILLVTAIMQIRYVNKALQRFDSTQVIPIQFVMFTLCVIIGSAVLYRDFEKTTTEQAGKFIGGCLLTFFGVFLITSGRERKDEEDMLSEADGIEETIGLTQHDGTSSYPSRQQQLPLQDEETTPTSQSRRSSRVSRVSFVDAIKPEPSPRDFEGIAIQYPDDVCSPAYLSGEESHSLVNNPWEESLGRSPSPSRGVRTISTDSVPSRPRLGSTPGQFNPTTPMRDHQLQPVYPTERPITPRGTGHATTKSASHRSRTFISPSPFSSTVTTAVKDVFLREDANSEAKQSSLRRIRSSIRASLFFNDEEGSGVPSQAPAQSEIPASDDNLPLALGHEEAVSSDAEVSRGRSRSLSDTLSDFFRSKRQKKQDAPSTAAFESEQQLSQSP